MKQPYHYTRANGFDHVYWDERYTGKECVVEKLGIPQSTVEILHTIRSKRIV